MGQSPHHVAVATNGPEILLLGVKSMNAIMLHGHTDIVMALDVSSCGQYLVSASKVCTPPAPQAWARVRPCPQP